MNMKIGLKKEITLLLVVFLSALSIVGYVNAQTDIRIVAPKKGFPISVPTFCDGGESSPFNNNIPAVISKNLALSGLFNVIDSSSVAGGQSCSPQAPDGVEQYKTIGAEGVVRGAVSRSGYDKQFLSVEIYLFDVLKKKAVLGKKYEVRPEQFMDVAAQFSDDVILYFSGVRGIFTTKIAYVSDVSGAKEIFVMDLNGQNVRQITNDGKEALYPTWSPDGEQLVYLSNKAGSPDLYSMSLKTRFVRQITGLPGEERSPRFSPDGKTIISSAYISGKYSIATFSLRGRLLQNLTPYTDQDVSASWSPDGKQIAFCSAQDGMPQIYVMDAQGGPAHRISYANRNYCTSPAWSPKGDAIAFVCKDKTGSQIFTATPQGKDVAQLTFQGTNEDPNWSPNGNMLVYSSDFGKPEATRQLAVFSISGGASYQITFNQAGAIQPSWSPYASK